MSCPNWGLFLLAYVALAVAVLLVWITKEPAVVAYLATLMTALSVVLRVLRGDRRI